MERNYNAVCVAKPTKRGDFSAEREGLRKQKETGGGREKDEHLLENILFFVESK